MSTCNLFDNNVKTDKLDFSKCQVNKQHVFRVVYQKRKLICKAVSYISAISPSFITPGEKWLNIIVFIYRGSCWFNLLATMCKFCYVTSIIILQHYRQRHLLDCVGIAREKILEDSRVICWTIVKPAQRSLVECREWKWISYLLLERFKTDALINYF